MDTRPLVRTTSIAVRYAGQGLAVRITKSIPCPWVNSSSLASNSGSSDNRASCAPIWRAMSKRTELLPSPTTRAPKSGPSATAPSPKTPNPTTATVSPGAKNALV